MCIAAKDMPNAMSDAAAGAIVGTTICVISAIADAIATAASGAVMLLAAMAAVFARGAVGGGRRSRGQRKGTGPLDGAIGWFKSWF